MRFVIFAFAAGVLLLQTQPELPPWRPWALAGLLIFPHVIWQTRLTKVLAVVACFAVGVAWAGWRAEARVVDHLGAEWEGRDVEVIGVIAGLPQDFGNGTRFEFTPEFVLTAAHGKKAVVPGRIMLSWYQGRRDDETFDRLSVRPGERWRFTVRLKRPHGNANPGGFDYEAWLFERNIRASGYIRPDPAQRLDEMVWRPDYAIERLRLGMRDAYERVLPAERYPLAGVLIALTIGDQKAVNGDLWTIFNRTGTTHLMSISGLHVTMVAALFGWLVSFVWRRVPALALRLPAQKAGVVAACLAALFYALLAGFAVPAQRTFYMLLVAGLAVLSGRLLAPSRILAAALLVVLLFDPWAVLAAGFWLSFGAVGALLYVASARQEQAPGWRQHLQAWGLVQWAATLASLPVLLLVFQQLSLVSPLANALAIPVISFVVTPLALLGAVLPWWPIPALAHLVLEWLMLFLNVLSGWPVWQAAAAPAWVAVLAACGVAICLLPRGVPGRALGLFLIFPLLFWVADKPSTGEAWVTLLDVGQGMAAVVRTREHTLIYDPGPLYSAESDAGQRVVVPYLRAQGVDRVDTMIITHRDSDHSGGAASVLAAVPVGEVLTSVPDFGGRLCAAGQRWVQDGVIFEMLHPAPGQVAGEGSTNAVSCVLRIEAGGRRILLTADIQAPEEAALLQRNPDVLAADVLQVAHHGSRTSSTQAFLEAVGASEAVIPVGYRNRFGHPTQEVLDRLAAQGMRVWRTDRDGAVDIHLGAAGVEISAWRQAHRRYWHGQ